MCSACGAAKRLSNNRAGGANQRLATPAQNQNQSQLANINSEKLKNDNNMVLVVYTTNNVAMHIVYSRVRPSGSNGAEITTYGRHRGATPQELVLLSSKPEWTVEDLKKTSAWGYSVFYMHKEDANARTNLFKQLNVVPQYAKPVQLSTVQSEDVTEVISTDDTSVLSTESNLKELRLVSNSVFAKMKTDGKFLTLVEIANADLSELASYFEDGKMPAVEKAKQTINKASSLLTD